MNDFNKFNFKDLFVLDLANNHQGSVEHGTNVIRQISRAVKKYNFKVAFKFQFRDLRTFIHANHRLGSKNKHVPRFLSTELSWVDFDNLLAVVRSEGLMAICTPFDEPSVDKIVEMGFDVIKVASCSARDWPLLDRIASTGLPIIASTGGLTQSEVDDLVSFLEHKGCDFALMHCVSMYPTPDDACNLGNIAAFKERYPGRVIGWSTHEPPDSTLQVAISLALGAEIFERHVGLETESIKLNAYSSSPAQVTDWFEAYSRAKILIGSNKRGAPIELERTALDDLKRGVFAACQIAAGDVITQDKVYFAFPYQEGQLSSGEFKDGIIASSELSLNEPITQTNVTITSDSDVKILKNAIHEVKAQLAMARVPLSHEFTTEYSHHYGVRNFREVGAVLINVINRLYAKKIIVQLAGQRHPHHYHKLKEETFLILWGSLISELDGKERIMLPGDTLTIPPGVWHSFKTENGCVFEEISTTAYQNDSVYRDASINKLTSAQRKTKVDHWGRFQLSERLEGQ